MNKEKLKTISIIILVVLIVGTTLYFLFINEKTKSYMQGYSQAINDTSNYMINSLKTHGYVPITYQKKTYALVIYQGNQTR